MSRSTLVRGVAAAAFALALVGCGGDDAGDDDAGDTATGDAEVCERLETEVSAAMDTFDESMTATDPEQAQAAIDEVVATMRDAADGGSDELVGAVDDMAAIFEEVGEALATGEVPNMDMDGFTEASATIEEICEPSTTS